MGISVNKLTSKESLHSEVQYSFRKSVVKSYFVWSSLLRMNRGPHAKSVTRTARHEAGTPVEMLPGVSQSFKDDTPAENANRVSVTHCRLIVVLENRWRRFVCSWYLEDQAVLSVHRYSKRVNEGGILVDCGNCSLSYFSKVNGI